MNYHVHSDRHALHTPTRRAARRIEAVFLIAVSLFALVAGAWGSSVPPITLVPSVSFGRFSLQWTAVADSYYLVQSTTNLDAGGTWQTVDAVKNNSTGPLKWMAPELVAREGYYRVSLPQSEIFSIDPAIVSSSGGEAVYITGQSLGTNGQVRVNGLVIPPNTLKPGTLYSFTTVALPPGTYDVDWLENGQVVATAYKLFSVTAEVQPVGRVQDLLEPPGLPPGSPEVGGTFCALPPNLGSSGQDGVSVAARRLEVHNLGSSGQDGVEVNLRRLPVHNLGSSGQDGVSMDFRRRPVNNLGSSGQDGVEARSWRPNNLGSSGQDGVDVNLRRLPVNNLGSSGQDGVSVEFRRLPVNNLGSSGQDGVETSLRRLPAHNLGSSGQDGVEVNLRRLPVHNLGSSGQDGVSVDLRRLPVHNLGSSGQDGVSVCADGSVSVGGPSHGLNNWPGLGGVQGFSGEVQNQVTDMAISGRGLGFVWTRTYRSVTGISTPMGNRWDFSYNVYVQISGSDLVLHNGAGRDDRFFLQTNGTYAANGYFCSGTLSNNVFRLTFADSSFWDFNPLDGSSPGGKLSRSQDRNGNTMSFGYDFKGRLVQIVDDLGRTNTVSYNAQSKLSAVTDFAGRSVVYTYYSSGSSGSAGDLVSCTSPAIVGTPNGNDFPSGKIIAYGYSSGFADDRQNHLLLNITDQNGHAACVFAYEMSAASSNYLRCVSQQHAGETMTCNYETVTPTPSNHFAVIEVFALDAVGNLSECFFDSRNRLVIQRDFTGRCVPGLIVTDTINRPSAPLRPCVGTNDCDPPYFQQQWTWNADNCCLAYFNPKELTIDKVYDRTYSGAGNPKKRGDLRLVRETGPSPVDTDGDGFPETASRSWHYDYDSRFGCPGGDYWIGWDASIQSKAINTKGTGATVRASSLPPRKGWDGTIKGVRTGWTFNSGPRQTVSIDSGPVSSGRFVVRAVDAAGNVDTAVLDAKGNKVVLSHEGRLLSGDDKPVTQLAYNSNGQLIGVTNVPDASNYRRVDVAHYYTNGPSVGCVSDWTIDTTGPTVLLTSYEYDNRGNLTRCVDRRGNDGLYVWNALDQCVRYQTPTNLTARSVVDISYDGADCVVGRTADLRDSTDNKYSTKTDVWSYDASSRCVAFAEQMASNRVVTTTFTWDANDNLTSISYPEAVNGHSPDNIQTYRYDERDLLFQVICAPATGAGGTNEYSYSPSGELVLVNERVETQIPHRYTYDGFDRRITATDPMGNVLTCAYDVNDNLVYRRMDGELNDVPGSAQNRRLTECRYAYDSLDRFILDSASWYDPATQLPLSHGVSTISYSYAPNSACRSVTDDNQHAVLYAYDSVGRCISQTNPRGDQMLVTYDQNGNVVSQTSSEHSDLGGAPVLFTCTAGYDSLNRRVSVADNVGNTNRCAYDSFSRVVRSVNAAGVLRIANYDYLDNEILLEADLDGDGIISPGTDLVQSATWDDNSRLVAIVDANGHTSTNGYDSLDRVVLFGHPDLTVSRFVYDQRGNCITNIDENGSVISTTYNARNNVIHRDLAARTGVATTTTFENYAYDGLGRCVAATNDLSNQTYAFDSLGSCIRSAQDGRTSVRSSDGVGNCLSMTLPSGRVMTYTYDSADQPLTVSYSAGQGLPPVTLATLAYEGYGRVGRITRNNGINTRITWNGGVNVPHNAADFGWRSPSGINHQIAGGGLLPVDRRAYSYDHNQNKTSRAQVNPYVAGQTPVTNAWTYDPLNRLRISSETGGAVHRADYVLDRRGNRLSVTNDGSTGLYSMDSTAATADYQMDQYTTTPFGSQQYDDNGNTIASFSSASALQNRYDCLDRLVEVDDLATGAPKVSFGYDALGRRVTKTVYPPAPSLPVTYSFVSETDKDCDGFSEIWSGGSLIDSCVNFPDDWARVALVSNSGSTRYFHSDDLDNVLALTDASGSVLERCDYEDYGRPTFLTSDGAPLVGSDGLVVTSSPHGNPFLFHGMFWDGETGLYLPRSRAGESADRRSYTAGRFALDLDGYYMDPKTGRFTCRIKVCDSLDCVGGGSDVSFEGNNPWSLAVAEKHIARIKWLGGRSASLSYSWTLAQRPQGSTAR